MTDANNKSNTDAVWASAIAEELAARAGGDFIAQVSASRLIFDELEFSIKHESLPVFVMGVAGMEERKLRIPETRFPVGDYQLKRASVEFWYASKTTSQSSTVYVAAPKQRTQEERIIELLRAQGHNPRLLPKREDGKRGAKADIKVLALREPALFSESSFIKAWDRLREHGEISESR